MNWFINRLGRSSLTIGNTTFYRRGDVWISVSSGAHHLVTVTDPMLLYPLFESACELYGVTPNDIDFAEMLGRSFVIEGLVVK